MTSRYIRESHNATNDAALPASRFVMITVKRIEQKYAYRSVLKAARPRVSSFIQDMEQIRASSRALNAMGALKPEIHGGSTGTRRGGLWQRTHELPKLGHVGCRGIEPKPCRRRLVRSKVRSRGKPNSLRQRVG